MDDALKRAIAGAVKEAFRMGKLAGQRRGDFAAELRDQQQAVEYAELLIGGVARAQATQAADGAAVLVAKAAGVLPL